MTMKMKKARQETDYLLRLGLTKPFYSPREVAELADLHPTTILNYIHAGRLYAAKLSDRVYRIPARAAAKFLYPEEVPPPLIRERAEGGEEAAAEMLRRAAAEHIRPARR